jgi:hypothetical protein
MKSNAERANVVATVLSYFNSVFCLPFDETIRIIHCAIPSSVLFLHEYQQFKPSFGSEPARFYGCEVDWCGLINNGTQQEEQEPCKNTQIVTSTSIPGRHEPLSRPDNSKMRPFS